MYDGFISYSHAGDGLLAPRLQAGLQRFAKPWWKRRALRIFRDESSLSANPHLWSSITEALDSSEWFVLLLSPEAAESEWVNEEIEYWRLNRDPSRILPVLTNGTFGWDEDDVTGTAAPESLLGAFAEEPRWVDLRFAKEETDLDLKDPRFGDAVADIASALRGVPKDELASEEVRQHRRTVRTAWTAGALVTILGIAAAVFAIQSAKNAEVARSRELAAAAVAVLGDDPELAMMLALESLNTSQNNEASPQGVIALRQALSENRLVARIPGQDDMAAWSPDGATLYHAPRTGGEVRAFDLEAGANRWVYKSDTAGQFHEVTVSPDGSLIAIGGDTAAEGVDGQPPPASVIVLDAITGAEVQILVPGECSLATVWSGFTPDGKLLGIDAGSSECQQADGGFWVDMYDTSTWEPIQRLTVPETDSIVIADFSDDMSRVLIYAQPNAATAELRSYPDLSLINTFENAGWAALSPDGQRVAYFRPESPDARPLLVEAETGDLISYLGTVSFASLNPFEFSANGKQLSVTTRDFEYIFDGETGAMLHSFRASGFEFSHGFTTDGSMLFTTSEDGVAIWEASFDNSNAGTPIVSEGLDVRWMNPNAVVEGPNLALWTFIADTATAHGTGFGLATLILDPADLEVESHLLGLGAAQMPDGGVFAFEADATRSAEDPDRTIGPTIVWDPQSGNKTIVYDCVGLESSNPECFVADWMTVSADGLWVAFAGFSDGQFQEMRIHDSESLELTASFQVGADRSLVAVGRDWIVATNGANQLEVLDWEGELLHNLHDLIYTNHAAFVGDNLLAVASLTGQIDLIDPSAWHSVARWTGHDGWVRGLAFTENEGRLATVGEDDFVNIWDITGIRELEFGSPPPLLDRIPATFPSDAAWLSESELLIFLSIRPLNGVSVLRVPLEVDEVRQIAVDRLTRGFTVEECAVYQIDDCPRTLEEIRER